MAVPQNIEELAHQVRTAIYGKDVRESIASSMEATADVADWARSVAQAIVDDGFDEAVLNTAIENKLTQLEQDYAPNLTSIETEVTNARGTETNLGNRLENVDAQLEQIAVNIKQFGAVGDGVTDDYEALRSAFQAISEAGSGRLIIPEGKYYIDKYSTSTSTDDDLHIENVDGLVIEARNAEIITKGDFHRTSTNGARGLSLMLFKNCKNVEINGLKMDGGLDKTTKDVGVTEPPSYGMRFEKCEFVTISNVDIKHFAADGIYIGWREMCRNFTLINAKSTYNGRQGLTISHLQNGTFINCDFSYIGQLPYGGHNPRAGVDIEPEWGVDEYTENIFFLNCRMDHNHGRAFLSMYPTSCRNVTIIGGSMVNPDYMADIFASFYGQNTLVQNVDMDTGRGWITAYGNQPSNVKIQNCRIKTRGRGLLATSTSIQDFEVSGCDIIGYHNGDYTPDYFVYLSSSENAKFENNRIFIPKSLANSNMEHGSFRLVSLISRIKESKNNSFETDYESSDNSFFAVEYAGTKVSNDNFPLDRKIRPGTSSSHDHTFPYSNGMSNTGEGIMTNGRKTIYRNAMPTSGSFVRGDYVVNTSDFLTDGPRGQYVIKGWQRLTYGTNHTLDIDWIEERIYIERDEEETGE